jgi:Zn-dependent protease with chaperone function
MQAFEKASDAFRDRFTRIFTRFYHGPVESVGKFNGYTSEDDVYWFSGESAVYGQATPVGTIILNKNRLKHLSQNAAELVYRHEQGHLDRLPVFRGIFWGMVINGAVGIYYLLKSLGYSLLIPFGLPAEPVVMLFGVSLLFIMLMIVTIRLEELAADIHVLRRLGEQDFLAAYEEISDESANSLGSRILKKLLYPRLGTVVRVHRILCSVNAQ